jgi:hypothetical protein
MHEGFM